MEPLQPVPMPTHAVLLELSSANTWRAPSEQAQILYLAYVATNSTQPVSFVSVNGATAGVRVLGVCARLAHTPEYQFGVVLELRLAQPLTRTQTVQLTLAQSGATTYYPAQAIDD